ncbi:helix-turn-helix domain-containing protein [Bacteroides hominis]|uniref:helix-turn-helix domain-containing protein n=1 Tax=Bacteroides hominis TaxID=2763023 RepID=UPI0039A661F0
MGNILDKRAVLDRIKQFYDLKGNAELSRFLGVAPNTITNWYARCSFDIDIIYTKCVGIDLNWLLSGKEPKPIKEEPVLNQVIPQNHTGEATAYYRMYKEKDEENKELLKENARLEERLRLAETGKSDFEQTAESASSENTLSRTSRSVTSAGAHLKG